MRNAAPALLVGRAHEMNAAPRSRSTSCANFPEPPFRSASVAVVGPQMPPADIARLGRVDGKILPFSATGCEPLPIRYLEQDMPNILAGDTGRARASGIAIALLALGSVSAAAEGCATHVTFRDGCRATDTCGGKAGQAGTGAGYGGVNASWGAGTTSSGGASGSHTATNGGGSAETSTAAGAAGRVGKRVRQRARAAV